MKLILKFITWYPEIRVEFLYSKDFDAIYLTFFYKHYVFKQRITREFLGYGDDGIVEHALIDIFNNAVKALKYPLDEEEKTQRRMQRLENFMGDAEAPKVEWWHEQSTV